MVEPGRAQGWSGGQWSLLRVSLGTVLVVAWSAAAIHDGGWRLAAPAVAMAFLVGWRPGLWLLVLTVAGGIDVPRCPWTWLAVGACVSLLLPAGPYGSWDARGRSDPGGGWSVPSWQPRVCLGGVGLLMAIALCANPLAGDGVVCGAALWDFGAAGAPVSLAWWVVALSVVLPMTRGLRWILVFGAWVTMLCGVDGDARMIVAFGSVVPLALAFDPAWLPRRRTEAPLRVFFDGGCGLCHGAVRFLVAEDVTGQRFRFAPLAGASFDVEVGGTAPETILVCHPDGSVDARSAAVVTLLRTLGGFWGLLAWCLWCIPGPLRDGLYDLLARWRHRLFAPPPAACPVGSKALMARFDD